MADPIIIPQNTIGQPIVVQTGGYALQTGQTVEVIFKQSSGGANVNLQSASVPLSFTNGAMQGTYTTVGGEFANIPGPCDAQLKVYESGLLVYSYVYPEYVLFQTPLG